MEVVVACTAAVERVRRRRRGCTGAKQYVRVVFCRTTHDTEKRAVRVCSVVGRLLS